MKTILTFTFAILLLTYIVACAHPQKNDNEKNDTTPIVKGHSNGNYVNQVHEKILVHQINPPVGFLVEQNEKNSFGEWLGNIDLKKDNTIYLFNGQKKKYQDGCYGVLNISVPDKDVQQCADALMRLRAEYLFSKKDFKSIKFKSVDGPYLSFSDYIIGTRWKEVKNRLLTYNISDSININNADALRKGFDNYLFLVFSFCNTYSLNQQVGKHINKSQIKAGDIFIRGGFPGHAVIAVATAKNTDGKRMAMFAQSYMPAQSIHIIINPENGSPWFVLDDNNGLDYSEYSFAANEAKSWSD